MNAPTLCPCGKPILSSNRSGKCLECRQRDGTKRPPAAVQFVYVIGGRSGPVKIGVSAKPNDRLAQLCATSDTTKMPADVDRSTLRLLYTVEGDRKLERHLQWRFRSVHVLGEWFNLGPPEVAWRQVRAEVMNRPVATELDLGLDALNGSDHVADLVRKLYGAVLDPSTRIAIRGIFPTVFTGTYEEVGT